jgi:hypothetical protein
MNITATIHNGPRYFRGITTEELQRALFANISAHARAMVLAELRLRAIEALATLKPNQQ